MRQVTRHAVRRQTISEFERAMIVERVNAGMRRARSEGRVGGRPRIDRALEAKARAMLQRETQLTCQQSVAYAFQRRLRPPLASPQ